MRRVCAGLVMVMLGGVGCGDSTEGGLGPTEDVDFTSQESFFKGGSRIKVRRMTTTEGLRWAEATYDAARLRPCTWQPVAPDGDLYCLSDNLHRTTWNETPFYVDESCTKEGVISASPLPVGTILAKEAAPPGVLQQLFHLGARVTGSVYLRDDSGGCHALPNNSSRAAYHFGDEVTGNTFVKGQLRQHVSKDGVAAHFVEGEDGSFSFHHLDATEHGVTCAVQQAQDASLRCLPSGQDAAVALLGGLSADASCSEPVLMATACNAPRFAVEPSSSRCETGVSVFSTGPVATEMYAISEDGTCMESSLGPNGPCFHRPGQEVPPTRWPEARHVDMEAHGRLVVRGARLNDSLHVPMGLFDTQLNADCHFEADTSGQLRCFPTTPTFNLGLYADASCTQALAQTYEEHCYTGPYAVVAATTAGDAHRAFHLGARHQGPTYAKIMLTGQPTRCAEVSTPATSKRWFLGEELPASELVPGRATLD
ncbi:hypothetical protein K8640_09545 [Myxococcus sp. XM-1-1-1]|uniref:DUF7481 family protein n=1 Tax=Myxococcus sp. XM-1-1-1 TaxID=2874602 RepID=UPI001CBC6D12|nr:hypothetical protein [Myxococcus sp. XM-1-1-1]MBZ4408456.1 hypothetical protein [Myxococcus sp. XM-1-1-1]